MPWPGHADDRSIDEYFKAYGSDERRRGQLELYRSGDFSELERYDLAPRSGLPR